MITHRQLEEIVKQLMTQKDFEDKVEQEIIAAAQAGKDRIDYVFPMHTDKKMWDNLFVTLKENGFIVSYMYYNEAIDDPQGIFIQW